MKCSHCTENKNIVYRDYAFGDKNAAPALKGKAVNICWTCLDELGWKKEIREILPLGHKCPDCKEFYVPKKITSTKKCGLCWQKFFAEKRR